MSKTLKCAPVTEATDPRILRSRQLLMGALSNLLNKKEFDEISIREIADKATLNRATFYLHYADKNALLQAMTAARFRDVIVRTGLSIKGCEGALRAIALGVCEYLADATSCPGQLTKMPLEGSIIPVVEAMFLEGTANHPVPPGVDPLLGTTAAWAIFGAARRWLETPNRVPAKVMAAKIEEMVKPILSGSGRRRGSQRDRRLCRRA